MHQREKAGRHRSGVVASGGFAVIHHSPHRHPLRLGQPCPGLGINRLDEVGQPAVGQHRLGRGALDRQNDEAVLLRVLNRCQPERCLADSGFAIDEQRRRLRAGAVEKFANAARLRGSSRGTQHSQILSSLLPAVHGCVKIAAGRTTHRSGVRTHRER